jgi:hypothetical protein
VAVEFNVQLREFTKAVRFLLTGRPRGKDAQGEWVDINARGCEVELVATGVSAGFQAEVTNSGYGRLPYLLFERFSKSIKTLATPSLHVSIEPGKVTAANLTLTHPDISIRLIGPRIADLPVDATLADLLALFVQYRLEEIEDSGLLARALAAQEEASKLIDQAFRALEPLGIERVALSKFVSEQIELRAREKK